MSSQLPQPHHTICPFASKTTEPCRNIKETEHRTTDRMEMKIKPVGSKEDARSRCKGWCWWWVFVFVFGVLVIALAVFTVLRKYFHSRPSSSGTSGRPGDVAQKYVDALGIAMQFFDVQKCMFEFFALKTSEFRSIMVGLLGSNKFYHFRFGPLTLQQESW